MSHKDSSTKHQNTLRTIKDKKEKRVKILITAKDHQEAFRTLKKKTINNQINKAKAISAELMELNLKNKLEETSKKQYETGRNRKKRGETEKLVKHQSKLS